MLTEHQHIWHIALVSSFFSVPPQITSTNTPVSAMEESAFALLSCEIEGQPTPDLTWLQPSGEPVPMVATQYSSSIQDNTAFLVVYSPNVSEHDGDFVCVLSNFLGSVNASVQVSVQGKPNSLLHTSLRVHYYLSERKNNEKNQMIIWDFILLRKIFL